MSLGMTWKFINIGKANAEIERLEKELADTKSQLQIESDNYKSAAEKGDEFISANTKLEAELKEKNARIASLESELTSARASASDFEKKVGEAASAKALEITAAQGQAPVISVPQSKPGQEQKKE